MWSARCARHNNALHNLCQRRPRTTDRHLMSGGSLSRRQADAQYRPHGYGLSPGLQRARAPYRVKNALTGLAIASFAVGVWAYSISAVKQDTFEDVDEEAKALMAERTGTSSSTSKAAATASLVDASPAPAASPRPTPALSQAVSGTSNAASTPAGRSFEPDRSRGILVTLFPQILEPGQTLVRGAPPIDRLGRMGERDGKRTE